MHSCTVLPSRRMLTCVMFLFLFFPQVRAINGVVLALQLSNRVSKAAVKAKSKVDPLTPSR
jgi:hypothetical protein